MQSERSSCLQEAQTLRPQQSLSPLLSVGSLPQHPSLTVKLLQAAGGVEEAPAEEEDPYSHIHVGSLEWLTLPARGKWRVACNTIREVLPCPVATTNLIKI